MMNWKSHHQNPSNFFLSLFNKKQCLSSAVVKSSSPLCFLCFEKNILFTCRQECFVMFWWFDTLSCRVFKCVFLGPRQSSTSAASWVTECPVWLSSGLTMTEKHMAAGCIHNPRRRICLWHWHSVSAGMSRDQTLKANVTACNRSRFEVALNNCQATSLRRTMKAHTAQKEPLCPAADRLISR